VVPSSRRTHQRRERGISKEKIMKLTRIVATGLAVALAMVLCAGPVVAADAKAAPSGKINLNTGTAEQLATVPGVGPKLAQRIVEHRQKEGSFRSVSELLNVKDIDHLGLPLPEQNKPPPPREVLRVAEHGEDWGVPADWQ
jgi:competence ComEA-like helix-hairpin-helix protein